MELLDIFFDNGDGGRTPQVQPLDASGPFPQVTEGHQEEEEAINFDEGSVVPVGPAYG